MANDSKDGLFSLPVWEIVRLLEYLRYIFILNGLFLIGLTSMW